MGTRKGRQRLVISLEFWPITLRICLLDEDNLSHSGESGRRHYPMPIKRRFGLFRLFTDKQLTECRLLTNWKFISMGGRYRVTLALRHT